MTDPRIDQYAAERTALAHAIHRRVNSSRIGATVPYSVGDAERAAAAVIMEGWTPPSGYAATGSINAADIGRVMHAIMDAPAYGTPDYVVHPTEAAWARNPVGLAPSATAVNVALAIGAIDGDHPEVQRMMRLLHGEPDATVE